MNRSRPKGLALVVEVVAAVSDGAPDLDCGDLAFDSEALNG